MLLRTQATLPALDNPEPTGAKRIRRWYAAGRPEPRSVPGLDVAALRIKYGPERAQAPRQIEGTFVVDYGVTPQSYERERNTKVTVFVEAMRKRGFDLVTSKRIQVYPGMNPALDATTGTVLLGKREFIIRAWFRHRAPKIIRTELDPRLLQPVRAAGA